MLGWHPNADINKLKTERPYETIADVQQWQLIHFPHAMITSVNRVINRFPLLFLMAVALVPRLYNLNSPVIGVHSWPAGRYGCDRPQLLRSPCLPIPASSGALLILRLTGAAVATLKPNFRYTRRSSA